MKKTNIVLPLWEKCKKSIEDKNLQLADVLLMELVWKLADYTMQGFKDADKIEGTSLTVWKERAWYAIENNGLLDD